jgi:hypothetical protein
MIAATVQGDVDGIPQGSHYASVPMIKPIGRLVGSATATLEDRLTAAVSTPNPSADSLQRDLLWVSGPSLVAVAPDLCVAAGESDRPAIKERQKVLIVETWVHSLIQIGITLPSRRHLFVVRVSWLTLGQCPSPGGSP